MTELIAEIDRDIFFLTKPELPNWKEAKRAPANPPLEWTPAEQQKGYIVFPVDYTEQITPALRPITIRHRTTRDGIRDARRIRAGQFLRFRPDGSGRGKAGGGQLRR